MPKFNEGAIKLAKEKGLNLIVLEINGKHAKSDSATLSGAVGPDTAKRIWELWAHLMDAKKRME